MIFLTGDYMSMIRYAYTVIPIFIAICIILASNVVFSQTVSINEEKNIEYRYYWSIEPRTLFKEGTIIKGTIISDRPIHVLILLDDNPIYDESGKSLYNINIRTQYDGYIKIEIKNDKPDLYDYGSIVVDPGDVYSKTYYISSGENVEITATISGGHGNDADIKIYDPNGYLLIGGRYSDSFKYRFTTKTSGEYRIVFGNTFSIISKKYIDYKIVATSPRDVKVNLQIIPPTPQSTTPTTHELQTSNARNDGVVNVQTLIILIAILAVLIGILIGLIIAKHKK